MLDSNLPSQTMHADLDARKHYMISESSSQQPLKATALKKALDMAKNNYAFKKVETLDYLDSVSFAINFGWKNRIF